MTVSTECLRIKKPCYLIVIPSTWAASESALTFASAVLSEIDLALRMP